MQNSGASVGSQGLGIRPGQIGKICPGLTVGGILRFFCCRIVNQNEIAGRAPKPAMARIARAAARPSRRTRGSPSRRRRITSTFWRTRRRNPLPSRRLTQCDADAHTLRQCHLCTLRLQIVAVSVAKAPEKVPLLQPMIAYDNNEIVNNCDATNWRKGHPGDYLRATT
jgi:hypothetical protein